MTTTSNQCSGTAGNPLPPAQGFWWWFLHRISGLLLLVLVAIHVWATHFSHLGAMVASSSASMYTFSNAQHRLAQAFFVVVDFSLLGLTLFHGLNGVRNILIEWPAARRKQRAISTTLAVGGLTLFVYGALVLVKFITA